jgi:hypothetical protein
MRWVGHEARMRQTRNALTILAEDPEGKSPFGESRCRREDNIKIGFKEIG